MTKEEKDQIAALAKRFEEFVDTYEKDMRGDNNPNGDCVGIVNVIRELKKYPSVTYLLFKKFFPTAASIVGIFILLETLYHFGLLRLLGGFLGIDIQ